LFLPSFSIFSLPIHILECSPLFGAMGEEDEPAEQSSEKALELSS
jgi:hypothetical protein